MVYPEPQFCITTAFTLVTQISQLSLVGRRQMSLLLCITNEEFANVSEASETVRGVTAGNRRGSKI